MSAVLSALVSGRAWFASRPQFIASHTGDLWRCGGFFCQWSPQRQRWGAWTHCGKAQWATSPEVALSRINYTEVSR